jgi:hypothetical protein
MTFIFLYKGISTKFTIQFSSLKNITLLERSEKILHERN